MPEAMTQTAPYPTALDELVSRLHYRPNWRFELADMERDPADTHGAAAGGLTFVITTHGYNSYHPEQGQNYRVNHFFVVPAATYNKASWLRWIFDCLVKVETHECMEFFALEDLPELEDECLLCHHAATEHDGRDSTCHGDERCVSHRFRAAKPRLTRPYGPTHGPGDDPYVVHEYASDEQARTSFRGILND